MKSYFWLAADSSALLVSQERAALTVLCSGILPLANDKISGNIIFENSSMKHLIVAFAVRKLLRLLFTLLNSVLFMRAHWRKTSLVFLGTFVLPDL